MTRKIILNFITRSEIQKTVTEEEFMEIMECAKTNKPFRVGDRLYTIWEGTIYDSPINLQRLNYIIKEVDKAQ